MENNVTKNVCLYKFLKGDLLGRRYSFKQIIVQEIFSAISIHYKEYLTDNYEHAIMTQLSEKTHLTSSKNDAQYLIYRCAIPFLLAKMAKFDSLSIASNLAIFLANSSKNKINCPFIKIEIVVKKPGWIDFYIHDREIVVWLNFLVADIPIDEILTQNIVSSEKSKKVDTIFPLIYIHHRCNSLLKMGKRENLINSSEMDNSENSAIDKNRTMSIKWHNKKECFYLATVPEKNVIWMICFVIDYLAENKQYTQKQWKHFNRQIGSVWLDFITNCRFFGEIQRQEPQLAIARWWLIAIFSWSLQNLLIAELKTDPTQESNNE